MSRNELSNTKKILMFIPTIKRGGGAQTVFLNLASQFLEEGSEVTLVVLRRDTSEPELPEGIKIEPLMVSRALFSVSKLIKVINNTKPDVVLSTMGHLNLIVAMIKPMIKKGPIFVARESNTVSKRLETHRCGLLFRILYRLFYNRFDLIIAQSKLMASDLTENFGVKKSLIKVIGNPIDVKSITDLSKELSIIPEKKTKFRLVTFGRHVEQKRFDLAVDLIGILGPDYELIIVGEGPFKRKLENDTVHKSYGDRVRFLPFQMNPFPIVASADYYIITSEYEGLPNAALEALALGLPVFGFNSAGGLVDYINKSNGRLVAFGDLHGLATVIKSTSLQKGLNIKSTVCMKLEVDDIARDYLAMFSQLR